MTESTPNKEGLFKKPVAETTALAILLFCLYAAIKELVRAKTRPKYKVLVAFGLAAVEWGIFSITGINPGEPKIIDIVSLNVPLLGVAIGFGIFAKHIDA